MLEQENITRVQLMDYLQKRIRTLDEDDLSNVYNFLHTDEIVYEDDKKVWSKVVE